MIAFSGLLFDLDGTLLDTAPDFVTSVNSLLGRYERAHLDFDLIRNRVSDGSASLLELAFTERLLKRLNLINRARCVICPDHVKNPKPHPESLQLGSMHLNVKIDECIYIGDHSRDILAAKNAEMRSILAAWGYINKHEDISCWNADWIALTPKELFDLLFKELEF